MSHLGPLCFLSVGGSAGTQACLALLGGSAAQLPSPPPCVGLNRAGVRQEVGGQRHLPHLLQPANGSMASRSLGAGADDIGVPDWDKLHNFKADPSR